MVERKKIGKRVQACRKKRNMSVEYLAEQIDLTPEFLRAVEAGQRGISLETLTKLSVALDTSCDSIIFGESSEDKYSVMIQLLEPCSKERIQEITTIVKQILKLSK